MDILKSCAVALAVTTLPHGACSATSSQHEDFIKHPWGEIDTQGLEALLKSRVPMTLVDARSDKWFDGILILGAQRLPSDAPEDVIKKTLPNKNQLVVVYCAGEVCDASKTLAKRLVDQGYKNVIDYHGGIHEWLANNKPIQKI
jgi:rhodanese-related sulfurtransferase